MVSLAYNKSFEVYLTFNFSYVFFVLWRSVLGRFDRSHALYPALLTFSPCLRFDFTLIKQKIFILYLLS